MTTTRVALHCPACPRIYYRQGWLDRHLLDAHSDGPIDEIPAPATLIAALHPPAHEPDLEQRRRGQRWAIVIDLPDKQGGPGMTVMDDVNYDDVSRTLSVLRAFGFRCAGTRLSFS